MAFRNPTHTLPADRITGQIQGSQLAADAIDGKVITGATVRTSAGVPRIQLDPDGNLYFYPKTWLSGGPAKILVDGDTSSLQIIGPNPGAVEYGLTLQKVSGTSSLTLDPDTVTVNESFYAGNYKTGRVTITPSAANTPTSVTISGVGMSGTGAVRAVATPSTTVPGTQVTGVGCSSVTRDGLTVWLTRTNTTATSVDYVLIGD